MNKKKLLSTKKLMIATAILLVLVAATVVFALPREQPEEDIIWREYKVTRNDITASLDGGGTLVATGVPHSFDVSLRIEQLLCELGQEVKVGDPLVQYSQTELQKKQTELTLALQKAMRGLEDAKNARQKTELQNDLAQENSDRDLTNNYGEKKRELKNAITRLEDKIYRLQNDINALKDELKAAEEAGDDPDQVARLKQQIRQADEELIALEADHETQSIALSRLTRDYDKRDKQNNQQQSAQDKIDLLSIAMLDNAVLNAQADVAKAQQDLAAVNKLVTEPVLTAKVDGIVTKLHYAVGDEAPAGKEIVTIGDGGKKLIIAQIPQEDIGGIAVGQEVEMQFLASPDATLRGKVIAKSHIPTEGGDGVNYKVTIELNEPQPELLQGMTCGVKFILKRVEDVLTLANKAIAVKDGKQYVTLLLSDGTHEEREIQTGFSDGRTSEITEGLADGDTVVKAG